MGIYTCSTEGTPRSCNVIKVRICGKPCLALIDSGAVVSLIKPEIAQGFITEYNEVSLVDIQDNKIPVLGKATLPIDFGTDIVVPHSFVVVNTDSFKAEILLGIDFLREYSVKIDWGNECMYAFEKVIPLCDEKPIDVAEVMVVKLKREFGDRLRQLEANMETMRRKLEQSEIESQKKIVTRNIEMETPSSSPGDEGKQFSGDGGRLDSNTYQHPEYFREEPSTSSKNLASSYFQGGLQVPDKVQVKGESREKKEKQKGKLGKEAQENERLEENLEKPNKEKEKNSCEKQKSEVCVQVILPQDIRIPSNCITVCPASVQGVTKVTTNHLVLEPSEDIPTGLLVARVLCKTGSTVTVRLIKLRE